MEELRWLVEFLDVMNIKEWMARMVAVGGELQCERERP